MPKLPDGIKIELDGREVDYISAFLFNSRNNDDPKPLRANAGKSFQGSIVLGMGFTFDDRNPDATSLAEMERLSKIEKFVNAIGGDLARQHRLYLKRSRSAIGF